MDKLKNYFLLHKITVILVIIIIFILFGGFFIYRSQSCTGPVSFGSLLGLGGGCFGQGEANLTETDLNFDAEGPFATLSPRRDGNALVLSLQRTGSYDSISYELAYTSNPDETTVKGNKVISDGEGGGSGGAIDRGVAGDIDTKDKKGAYEQEILFGTCSKNVCKYDQGVENGTLTLHIKKGDKAYRMITQWHLQKPDVALGILTSGDNHFTYKVAGDRQALSNIGFTIINDLTGVPKLPSGKQISGKVYSLNAPIAKEMPGGDISLELAENPSSSAKLYRYDGSKSEWQELDTKASGSTLSAKATGAGIFAVLTSK